MSDETVKIALTLTSLDVVDSKNLEKIKWNEECKEITVSVNADSNNAKDFLDLINALVFGKSILRQASYRIDIDRKNPNEQA